MEKLNELNEAIKKVIEITNSINDETTAEIYSKAPLIIHQRFCIELVNEAKKNVGKKMNECNETLDVMTAIRILEKLYPELAKI